MSVPSLSWTMRREPSSALDSVIRSRSLLWVALPYCLGGMRELLIDTGDCDARNGIVAG